MSTNFNRNRAQLRCESFLNCATLEQWKVSNFRQLRLTPAQATLLDQDLKDDSKDMYYKGLLSLFEAIKSINAGLFSWATVKIYYSIFYFLKCTMALNGVALVRQRSLYYLKAVGGSSPITKGHKKYNSDHSGTINYYIDLFSSDILLSQSIGLTNSYEWLMEKREQVNYRERSFHEPNYSSFWAHIAKQIENGKLKKLIKNYWDDNFLLSFQEENAVLAVPIKRAILTNAKLIAEGVDLSLTSSQKGFLINLLPPDLTELQQLLETQQQA